MTTLIHYGTCRVWQTGTWADCTCKHDRPWRIRRLWAGCWQTYRWTEPDHGQPVYEPFISCITQDAAMQLVDSMIWLARSGLENSRMIWTW